jgi:hypothetical protein
MIMVWRQLNQQNNDERVSKKIMMSGLKTKVQA